MYRCRRPIIFRLINLVFLILFVTAILAVPLMRSMLGTREVHYFQTEKRNIVKTNRNFHVHVLTRQKDVLIE